ncbi:MAG: hypothetical protein GTO45_16520 [Candidatus Aminicenantes bacterium]|nr:hypothetical protein [Candidatus Aminicenantes bacterium]NIM78306.1 hypothetical protein [Candidatus Aminicenantes bacterium]NIN19732.1 hypothetical protein [Candidatus Aminicenantes bacterium]NIN43614.1 hypothetical protein [Candidatus Aminicenantes bacterium]NIN86359.1 hypothetical protein [Candidatus Aminicenantes bacterium]
MIIKVKCYFPAENLLLATKNLQDSSGNWQNKIISISSLSRNIGEDKSYEISGISIELNDSDRFFRTMMSGDNRYIAGKKVEILDENDTLIYTGNVEKWEFTEDALSLFINDRLSGLDTVIPHTLTTEDYPDAADEGVGTSIPIIYGHVQSVKGAVKCWKVESGKYLLAGHHCMSLEGVFKEDGTDVSTDFQLSNEGSAAQGNEKAYAQYIGQGTFTEDSIHINVKGKMQDSALIEHPMTALEDIIANYTDMTLSTLNQEENQAIMNDRNYIIAAVIHNQKTVKDFLIEFAFSFDCDFYLNKGNEIVVVLLNWDNLQPEKSLNKKQITNFQLQELPEAIRNKVKYMYRYNYAEEKYQRLPLYERSESISNWGEFYNKNEALACSCVYDENTAFDVVQRYAFQRKNPQRIAVVELPLDEFAGLDISDIVEMQHPGSIDEKKRKYQIRRVNIDFLSDAVQMECVDITSLAGGIFILGDDSFADNWEEADDYERQFAYLCDSDGFFANDIDEGKILY